MFLATADGKESKPSTSVLATSDDNESIPSTSSMLASQPCRRHFEFSEILIATKNFDESLVIGSGGFGKVYKGNIVNGSSIVIVAIKRMDSMSNQGEKEFRAEVKVLSMLRHCNLVSLIGYCNYGIEMILVYEYMPNGTLNDHLHILGTPLSWLRRLNICIGAARGLHYLHTGTGIESGVIHRDIKSSNILLHESWAAKLSDFGLSKIGMINQPSTYVKTLVKGTFGYLDPNYYATGKLTRKSDVYSFGVVLLEVLCRKRAVDESLDEDQLSLATWVQDSIKEGNLKKIIDSDIRDEISPKCLKKFVRIAERCLHINPKQRPTMDEVLFSLKSILVLQEKINNSLQSTGKTIFGKIFDMLPFTSNELNSEPEPLPSPTRATLDLSNLGDSLTYQQILAITSDLSSSNLIKHGRSGDLYRGVLEGGTPVVVKSFNTGSRKEDGYMVELNFFSKVFHSRLVPLLGHCLENKNAKFLIYMYMPNGDLSSSLYRRNNQDNGLLQSLDWITRLQIATGAAEGLSFLHHECKPPVGHGDVQASSILLDHYYQVRLGSLSEVSFQEEDDHSNRFNRLLSLVQTSEQGTSGLANAICAYDVSCFGKVLLELVTGKMGISASYDAKTKELTEEILAHINIYDRELMKNIIDPSLIVDADLFDEVWAMAVVARSCLNPNPARRPPMRYVLKALENPLKVVRDENERSPRLLNHIWGVLYR